MDRIQIPGSVADDQAAQAACSAVNQAIEAVTSEAAQIEREAAALIAEALATDPTDAGRLAKRVEALRVRKLANIMRELQIPALKEAAQTAVRAAAARVAEVQASELASREGELNAAADKLGLAKDALQRTSLIRSDKARNVASGKASDARSLSINFKSLTDGDRAAVESLRLAIQTALTV